MLEILTSSIELFDSETESFEYIKPAVLQLEHSLISLRKWEQKWHKPFLGKDDKTIDEMRDYIRCMSLNHGIDERVYKYLSYKDIDKVIEYIKNPMTATWFNEDQLMGAQRSSREVVTAEIIYYWMIALNIPVEFEKWHLNQLLTLIKVVNIKNDTKKPKKVNKRDAARERAALNAKRRAKYNSKG